MVDRHRIARPRRYVSPFRLYAMMPALRFSYERGAYVLRLVGETRGPVLRKDRRRAQVGFSGPDRREGAVDPLMAGRPMGGVRRIEPTVRRLQPSDRDAAREPAEAIDASAANPAAGDRREPNPRRRQHDRQRPPRPRH